MSRWEVGWIALSRPVMPCTAHAVRLCCRVAEGARSRFVRRCDRVGPPVVPMPWLVCMGSAPSRPLSGEGLNRGIQQVHVNNTGGGAGGGSRKRNVALAFALTAIKSLARGAGGGFLRCRTVPLTAAPDRVNLSCVNRDSDTGGQDFSSISSSAVMILRINPGLPARSSTKIAPHRSLQHSGESSRYTAYAPAPAYVP